MGEHSSRKGRSAADFRSSKYEPDLASGDVKHIAIGSTRSDLVHDSSAQDRRVNPRIYSDLAGYVKVIRVRNFNPLVHSVKAERLAHLSGCKGSTADQRAVITI